MLVSCGRSRGDVYVVDESGNAVAGASVRVSYPAPSRAPEFSTDKQGYAKLTVKNFNDIQSITVTKGVLLGRVNRDQITWPLRVTID